MAEDPTHRSPAPTTSAPSPALDHARVHAPSSLLDHAPGLALGSVLDLASSQATGHPPDGASNLLAPTAPGHTPNVPASHAPNVPAVSPPTATVPVYAHWRDQPSLRNFIHDFAGWRVLYTSHGNSTLLLSPKGPMHYLDAPVTTLVQAVADWYYLDLEMLHKLYFKWIGHQHAMPIPVGTSGDMFVAFKTRQPRATNDGVISYIAATQIATFVPQQDRTCTLTLKSGYVIPTLWSVAQCIEQIRIGGLFLTMLIHEHAIPSTPGMTNHCTPDPFIHLARGSRRFTWY